MAWRAILEADVLLQISGDELESLREAALKAGQVDPLQPSIDAVTRQVRAYVRKCPTNQLGEGNTIPDELMNSAVALIVPMIMTRAAGTMIDPKSARAGARQDALTELREVANCGLALEQPTTVSDEVTSSGSSVIISQRPKQVTGKSLGSL